MNREEIIRLANTTQEKEMIISSLLEQKVRDFEKYQMQVLKDIDDKLKLYFPEEVINMLAASGAGNVIKGVKQTYGNFTAPVESFEHGAKTGHVFINDNPINAYCFGNAVLDTDKLENCKPVKRKHNQKIDGVITKLMCMRLFIDYER